MSAPSDDVLRARLLAAAAKKVRSGKGAALVSGAEMLVLALESYDVPEELRTLAGNISECLQKAHAQWLGGEVEHVEDALKWRRPAGFRRGPARRRFRYKALVVEAVRERILAGARTPNVFAEVAKLQEFPVSASLVREWYYEHFGAMLDRRDPAERRQSRKTFQKSRAKSGKTRRS